MAGLVGRERTLTRDLAGGWRQRLALGCAILHEPSILFLDEPTGGVDPLSRRQFWQLIDRMSGEGVTVFVTTHYLDEAEHCHRLALMQEALRALDGVPSVEKTSLFGTALHVWLKPGERDMEPLRRRFQERGLIAESLELVQPSLEDVFMDVVERAGGASA